LQKLDYAICKKTAKNPLFFLRGLFKLKRPDALTAYKAAGVYALERNVDKAFFYLETALRSGWTEAGRLSIDPYFDYLRASKPERWRNVETEAFLREAEYEESLQLPALRKRINVYGTQVNWTNNGKQLRYKRVQARDSTDLAYTKQLIDSASNCFTNGEFEKTYDYYNRASTISGGMSNMDMYNAAIVFAMISSKVGEQRYKDIALDFLNLLYLRQELTKNRLEAQYEFAILSKEQRSATIYQALK
jgi:hypothetical protein